MRLHLVDGTYELFRAHFSKRPPREAPDGQDVKATVGMASSLLRLLEDAEESVSHVAVAFDNPIESWRNDRYEGYKDSAGVDPALLAQFDLVEEAVAALGVTVWSMREFEADDALASATTQFKFQVEQVRILTPDKDLGQVVDGTRVVQVDRRRERTIDENDLREKFGVSPVSVPDYLALVGDSADGIPGLAGFGAKSTATLLSAYPHLEDIPKAAHDWSVNVRGSARLATTLVEHLDDALLFRELATLNTDVTLSDNLDDLAFTGVPRARFSAFCERLGAETLAARPTRWAS